MLCGSHSAVMVDCISGLSLTFGHQNDRVVLPCGGAVHNHVSDLLHDAGEVLAARRDLLACSRCVSDAGWGLRGRVCWATDTPREIASGGACGEEGRGQSTVALDTPRRALTRGI